MKAPLRVFYLNHIRLVREEELLRQEVADFALTKKEDVACLAHSGMDRVRLNVGGQVKILCAPSPPCVFDLLKATRSPSLLKAAKNMSGTW